MGCGARNDLADVADVAVLQTLFKLNIPQFPDPMPAKLSTDGIVAPGDATIKALLRGLPPGPSEEKLAVVLPLALDKRIAIFYDPLVQGMTAYGINSPLQMAPSPRCTSSTETCGLSRRCHSSLGPDRSR